MIYRRFFFSRLFPSQKIVGKLPSLITVDLRELKLEDKKSNDSENSGEFVYYENMPGFSALKNYQDFLHRKVILLRQCLADRTVFWRVLWNPKAIIFFLFLNMAIFSIIHSSLTFWILDSHPLGSSQSARNYFFFCTVCTPVLRWDFSAVLT